MKEANYQTDNLSAPVTGSLSIIMATSGSPVQIAKENRPFYLPQTPELFCYRFFSDRKICRIERVRIF
ncbi:MAG: hypothetical protein WCL04_08120, partial [Verrucomicrobiota bacterium]